MTSMPSLPDYFNQFVPIIEADIQQLLTEPAKSPPLFYRMLNYHMGWVDENGNPVNKSKGKRIRPVLALLVSQAVCGDHAPARPAAAAVELIHNFSLLHDDIQDGSPLRHNRPAAWKIWGSEQGINAGDAMFALAHLAIPRLAAAGTNPALLAGMLYILDETCLELTRGQHLDMTFEKRSDVAVEEYLDMISGKTAALVAASAQMGALAANGDEEIQEHYRAFGLNLGLAFQVMDDVLDIWGDPELTGKEAAVDIRQRKKSLPVLYGLAQNSDLRDHYLSDIPMDDARVQTAIQMLDQVDARDYAEDLAKQYSASTIEHLEAASPQEESGQVLYSLVDMLLMRSY
jgi:geranylgeranyl diphosphate synthase, type I